jgi:quercetin dioxygenase-like cupin family protein
MSSFSSYTLTHGCLQDLRCDVFPTILHGWAADMLDLDGDGTHFGYVHAGPASLACRSGTFTLQAGMYFAVPGDMTIGPGHGIVITRLGYKGFLHVGGPVEARGRLRYIDGCSDSLLIPPIVHGDACLNLLHLPANTRQTPHTHPSMRIGLVIRGAGYCVTHEERVALEPGQAFVIAANGMHCFHTEASTLLVLAYHPDSDFGPTDEDHPMINRTILPAAIFAGRSDRGRQ